MRKKLVVFTTLLFVLSIAIFINSCADMTSKYILFDFSALFNNEDIEDLSLTIYYTSPFLLTDMAMSVDDLKQFDETKIIVCGKDVNEFAEKLLKKQDDFVRVDNKSSYINARMYYVLESKKNGKLIDVVMWGADGENRSMFINGIEIKEDKILYDAIIPFLPESSADEWKRISDEVT